jgi:hypothetical protein
MHGKKVYDFLFDLYDYADYIAGEIQPGNADNASYFMTLIYIEDIMDTYGRGLIHTTAINSADPGIDPSEALHEAHRRIDLLRERILSLKTEYNLGATVQQFTDKINRNWH